jgi:UPF0716 family protein affecting phage T7 exclusion
VATADRRWPAWKVCFFVGMAALLGLVVILLLVILTAPGGFPAF